MVFYSYVGQFYSVKSVSVSTKWNWTIRLRKGRSRCYFLIFPDVFSHFQAKDWQWSAQAMSASTGWKWPTVDKKCCWQKQQEQRRRKQLNSCCLWPLDLDNKVEYVDQKNMYSKEFNIYWFRIFWPKLFI